MLVPEPGQLKAQLPAMQEQRIPLDYAFVEGSLVHQGLHAAGRLLVLIQASRENSPCRC